MNPDYPNDGEAVAAGVFVPEKDQEQQKRIYAERQLIQTTLPIFKDLIDWFNAQVEWAGSLQRIELNAKVPTDAQILAFQEVQRLMTEKRDELANLHKLDLEVLRDEEATDGRDEKEAA